MAWNLPPGCTGNEYQIAGAEKEWDEQQFCRTCEEQHSFEMAAYSGGIWGICDNCGETQDFDGPDDEDPNAYDTWKDLQADEDY